MTQTKLGWIVHGMITNSGISLESLAIVNTCCEHDDNLHDLVKTFMTLDNFGVLNTNTDRRNSEEKRLSIAKMEETIKLNGQHYEFGLPYKPEREGFSESRPVAFHKMKCIEQKKSKLGLVEQYNEKVSEIVRKGYADVVQDMRDLKGKTHLWYLLHQRWRSEKFKSWQHRKKL
jgi:hypothetical protein